MLKFIFICLLLINGLLFVLWRGYLVNPLLETPQPQRLLQQQNSGHLKLIEPEVTTEAAVVPDAESACLEWGSFSARQVKRVEAKLKALPFGERQSREAVQENVPDPSATMVFIPSLGSKQAAEKKVLKLKKAGVKDLFILQDPPNLRWGISLGVFKSEAAAKQLVATLIKKGVSGVQISARTVAITRFNYVFKKVSSVESAALNKLSTEFPAQELHDCP